MATLAVLGQKQTRTRYDRNYLMTEVRHDGGTNTVSVDQSATQVAVIPLEGQTAPTATLGSADSNNQKDVTLTGGASGRVEVITLHGSAVASSKP